jgi:uncharacterized protein
MAKAPEILSKVTAWAGREPSLAGLLLVGSYARGTPRADSDLDLMLLSTDPAPFLQNHAWIRTFGAYGKIAREKWGLVETLRVTFNPSCEVEFNFALPGWASVSPIDPGTFQVVADGAKVLFDPSGRLKELLEAVAALAEAGPPF